MPINNEVASPNCQAGLPHDEKTVDRWDMRWSIAAHVGRGE